jgi:two-component system, cell cycle response regulator DivK
VSAQLILIVDDDERNRRLVRDVLQAAGLSTIEAATGEEALALTRAEHPDVVLLDVRLPDLDGSVVVGRLKADPVTSGMPVIAVTALAGATSELISAGFDGVLEKPIDVVALPAQVRGFSRFDGDAGLPPHPEAGPLDGTHGG